MNRTESGGGTNSPKKIKTKNNNNNNYNSNNSNNNKISTLSLSTADQQKLPLKLQNIFDRNIISGYEDENYSITILECDKILLEYPEHGETLSMKGLCIYTLGNKLKGIKLVNKGLKNNIKSSICWRVKGLIYRNKREYNESIKCYKKSLSFDKENTRIKNDLSILYLQIKNFNEYNNIREVLWKNQRDQQTSIAYMISNYISKNYKKGLKFINQFLNNYNENIAKFNPIEFNQILILKVKYMIKLNKLNECIIFINKKLKNGQLRDLLFCYNIKKNIYIKLKQINKAIQMLHELIDINCENREYYYQYIKIKISTKIYQ